MKKGLRPVSPYRLPAGPGLNIFPDEEGIKTGIVVDVVGATRLNIFPDEEGIKTACQIA